MGEGKRFDQLLSSFLCEEDADIEYFLHSRSVEFEKLSKSRTYLLFDENDLKTKSIYESNIIGYVALAQKVLSVPDSISNRKRKEFDGLNAKNHGNIINDFPCYLIGQLARNSAYSNCDLTGSQLLDLAYLQIKKSVDAVGGRLIMIECKNTEKLLNFYTDNGFEIISNDFDNKQEMIQMVRRI